MEAGANIQPLRRSGSADLVVVFNPHASGVRPKLVASVRAELARWGARTQTLMTESAEEWVDALHGDAERRVVLVGGDGTVHAAANTGVRRDFGLIPAGRANNVARSLGIPLVPHDAARLAVEGRAKPIDLIEAVTPSRRYVTVEGVSVGFLSQARSYYTARNSGDLAGALAAGARALAEFQPFAVRAIRAGRVENLTLAQLFVPNLPLYGFGLHVAPHADANDSLLDVIAIDGRGRQDLLPMILRLLRGTEVIRPEVHRWQAERVRIDTHGALPVFADSCDLGSDPVHLSVLPGELRIVRP